MPTKKTNSPTNDTTRLILQFLFSARVFAWRQNVLPVPMVRKGLLTGFRSGSKQGLPDIMGIVPPGLLPSYGGPLGIPLCIEVKTGKDKLRPQQVGFLETAAKMGALVFIVKDYDNFLKQWHQLFQ